MEHGPKFIKVKKILDRDIPKDSEKKSNLPDGHFEVKNDNIPVADVTGFRNYEKNGSYKNITGPVCQIQIKSKTAKEGFFTIRIEESEESFGSRVGTVIPLPE